MTNKPKIALVGVGKWGKKLLSELVQIADVPTVISSGSKETQEYIQKNYPEINLSSDVDEVLNNPAIEAVVVATPTQTHFEIARKVLAANKHLFLEKPGTTKASDLEILQKQAEEKGLTFCIGYEFIHHPALSRILEEIANKEIKFIEMEWFKWGTFNDAAPAHLLSHEISILKMLLKDEVKLEYFSVQGAISDSDICHSHFVAKDTKIHSLINRISPEKRKTVTVKTEDTTYIWNNNDLFKISPAQNLEKIEIDTNSPVKNELTDFINSYQNKTLPKSNGKFGVEIYKTIEQLKP